MSKRTRARVPAPKELVHPLSPNATVEDLIRGPVREPVKPSLNRAERRAIVDAPPVRHDCGRPKQPVGFARPASRGGGRVATTPHTSGSEPQGSISSTPTPFHDDGGAPDGSS